MIPGYEQTGGCHNGQQVHMNSINVREVFPYISAEKPKEILEKAFEKGQEMYGADYLFTADHPLGRYYDYAAVPQSNIIGPEGGQVLVDRSVELINSMW